MACRSKQVLNSETKEKIIKFEEGCLNSNIDILIYCTNRSLEEQAKLYRKSRTTRQIKRKIGKFKDNGFGFLADIIEKVGVQFGIIGDHVTYAACGESFHNYGSAFDFVPLDGGKALWHYEDNKSIWDKAGSIGVEVGLEWAADWSNFKERCHLQTHIGGNPPKLFNQMTIKKMLEKAGMLYCKN